MRALMPEGRLLRRRPNAGDPVGQAADQVEQSLSESSNVSQLPDAMRELLLRYFGVAALPSFALTPSVFADRPYQNLRDRITEKWALDDLTDLNYDLGWQWWIHTAPAGVLLRLSFVGPYAVMVDRNGKVSNEDSLEEMVRDAGFTLLCQSELEVRVDIWSPELEGSVYEFLFEFDNGPPWSRDSA